MFVFMEDCFDELVVFYVIVCVVFLFFLRFVIWVEMLFFWSWGEVLVLWWFLCRNFVKIDFYKFIVMSGLFYCGVDSC